MYLLGYTLYDRSGTELSHTRKKDQEESLALRRQELNEDDDYEGREATEEDEAYTAALWAYTGHYGDDWVNDDGNYEEES